MKKCLLFLIFPIIWAFVLAIDVRAQTYDTLWTKAIGGIQNDGGSYIRELSDGNYIITGSTSSYGAGHQDVYLIKANSDGGVLWTNAFGGGGTDFGRSIVETENGDIMVFGVTYSFGDYIDFYLIKVNSMGDTIWTKTYGGSEMESGFSIARADTGFVLLGTSTSYGAGNRDVYLIRINNDGDTLWTKTYGGSLDDEGFSIQQTFDGGFIITGYTKSFGTGLYDIYLIKIDSMGDTLWTRVIGGNNNDIGWDVHQTPDDGYMIAGVTDSTGTDDYDIYIVKTDSIGNLLWTRSFGGNGFDLGSSLCETAEGNYLIAGSLNLYTSDSSDAYIINVNDDGDSLWAMTIGGSGNEGASSIYRTSDDKYIIVGSTSSSGAGGTDVYLLKLSSDQSDIKDVDYKPRFVNCSNYPNPFNARTRISLQLSSLDPVEIGLYDLLGRKVKSIFEGVPRDNHLEFDIDLSSDQYSSGIYFIVAEQGADRRIVKSTLLK